MTRWKRELEGPNRFHYAITDRERYQRYRAFREHPFPPISSAAYLNLIAEIRDDIGFYNEYPSNSHYDPKKFIPPAKSLIRDMIEKSRSFPAYPLPG